MTVKAPSTPRPKKGRAAKAQQPRCIDLFAGAGGLADGFRRAGWEILAAVENDPHAAATFRLNFPKAIVFEADVATLKSRDLLSKTGLRRGELECLAGGPPCQSFSYNNHARSASGQRAKLFRHYLRIVRDLNPKTLIMENVPGMLTIGGGKIVTEITKSLAKLGYKTGLKILFAEDYGVPQERRRLFLVATRLGWEDSLFPPGTHGPSAKPAPSRDSVQGEYIHRWEPKPGKAVPPLVTVWDAISDLSLGAVDSGNPRRKYARPARTNFQRQARGKSTFVSDHRPHTLSDKMLRRIRSVPEGGNWTNIPRRHLPAGMKRAEKSDHTKRYGRLSRRGRSSTILTKCDPHWGTYVHPIHDRTITVREAARLQSFHDSFKFAEELYSKHYIQVGNAVPPLVAKHFGLAIKRHVHERSRARSRKRRGPALTKRHTGSRAAASTIFKAQ